MDLKASRALLVLAGALVIGLSAACGGSEPETAAPAAEPAAAAPAAAPAQPGRVSHVFRGRVEAVDPAAKTLKVFNENVEGWMGPMSMAYSADKDEVYSTVKVGDQITATVYDGDFKTLYDVRVVPGGAPSPQ